MKSSCRRPFKSTMTATSGLSMPDPLFNTQDRHLGMRPLASTFSWWPWVPSSAAHALASDSRVVAGVKMGFIAELKPKRDLVFVVCFFFQACFFCF